MIQKNPIRRALRISPLPLVLLLTLFRIGRVGYADRSLFGGIRRHNFSHFGITPCLSMPKAPAAQLVPVFSAALLKFRAIFGHGGNKMKAAPPEKLLRHFGKGR